MTTTVKPNVGGCPYCGHHDHANHECQTCRHADGPCRALLHWEAKVLRAILENKVNTALAGLPVPAPHPDPASLEKENARLNEKLQSFIQTAWEAQAQVDRLLKEVKDLREQNEAMHDDIQKWRTAAHASDQRMYNLAKDMADAMEKHGFFVARGPLAHEDTP